MSTLKLEALFIIALFAPLVLQLMLLFVVGRLLWAFTGRYFGRIVWSALALVGVPVHELSHAVAFWLTGAGVRKLVLFAPRGLSEHGGATGVTVPARQPSTLSLLASSIAPFFGCSLAAWGILALLLPGFEVTQPDTFLSVANFEAVSLGQALLEMGQTYLNGMVQAFTQLNWSQFTTYVAIYAGASLGMGAPPSTEDLKHFFPALLILLVVLFPVIAIVQVTSSEQTVLVAAQNTLAQVLVPISAALSYATVFAILMLLVLVALLPFRRIFR